MLFIRNRRYDTITPTGLPCHREPSIAYDTSIILITQEKLNIFLIHAIIQLEFLLLLFYLFFDYSNNCLIGIPFKFH